MTAANMTRYQVRIVITPLVTGNDPYFSLQQGRIAEHLERTMAGHGDPKKRGLWVDDGK